MNLLVRKHSIKNFIKPGLILLISVFLSCETENDNGIRYRLDSNTNVKLEEFTLSSSNIFIDSLRTDGENSILVGDYTDPLTGGVTAEGYFQLFYERGPLPRAKNFFMDTTINDKDTTILVVTEDTLKIDSIVLFLETNATIPQRGVSFQEFSLFDLQDTLDSRAIYLSNFKQNPQTEIGTYSKPINVALDTIYRVRFSESYTDDLYDKIREISGDPDQSFATTVFRSFGLIPTQSSESIASFDLESDTSRLVLYSSPISTDSKDTTYLTYLRSRGINYTYLDRDRSGTVFEGIEENENFDLSDGKTIIDPIAGLSTVISIEQLSDFFLENPNILMNNVTISFEFESEDNRDTLINFMSFIRKPDDSFFGPSTVSNSFGNIVMNDNAYLSLNADPANGALSDSKESIQMSPTLFYQQLFKQFNEGDSLAYLVPTTGVVKDIDDFVLISPFDVTLQRTIFKENGVKIKIYYTEVNQ